MSLDGETEAEGKKLLQGHPEARPAPYLWHRGQRRSARVCG